MDICESELLTRNEWSRGGAEKVVLNDLEFGFHLRKSTRSQLAIVRIIQTREDRQSILDKFWRESSSRDDVQSAGEDLHAKDFVRFVGGRGGQFAVARLHFVDYEGGVGIDVFPEGEQRDASIGYVELLENGARQDEGLVAALERDTAGGECGADFLAEGGEVWSC